MYLFFSFSGASVILEQSLQKKRIQPSFVTLIILFFKKNSKFLKGPFLNYNFPVLI